MFIMIVVLLALLLAGIIAIVYSFVMLAEREDGATMVFLLGGVLLILAGVLYISPLYEISETRCYDSNGLIFEETTYEHWLHDGLFTLEDGEFQPFEEVGDTCNRIVIE